MTELATDSREYATADVVAEALALVGEGRAVVDVHAAGKRPVGKGWERRRYSADDVRRVWGASPAPSLGILLGEPSGWLVDVDLDAEEARRIAERVLPATHRWHGRASSRRSHAWVISRGAKTRKYTDPTRPAGKSMLVEVRSSGCQTVAPPSIHETGEPCEYEERGEPAEVAPADLYRATDRIAACALLGRYWPTEGSRHVAALALAGMLLRGGMDEREAVEIVELVCLAAGDSEVHDRVRAVRDTAEALKHGKNATGGRSLAELLPHGDRVVREAAKWLELRDSRQAEETAGNADQGADEEWPRLRVVTAAELLSLDLKPRQMIMTPWLPAQGLAMIYAQRGVGKTYLALAVAHAIAAGSPLLSWRVPHPRRVLYLDGEMPAVSMRERLARIIRGSEAEAAPDALRLLTPDLQDRPMPDLSTPGGRLAVEPLLDGVDVVVVDSVSTLSGAGENEADDWLPLQRWALDLRRSGRSVLLIHHAGKTGAQRGTSRREDVLDTVLALRRPSGYRPEEGARFDVVVEKGRSIHGDDARTIEVSLLDDGGGGLRWTYRTHEESLTARVAELLSEGMTYRQVATELGIGLATVTRHRRAAIAAGLLDEAQS